MIHFNGFRLDPDRRVLVCGAGTTVALSAPGFDMLVCLIEGRDRILSKKDIIDTVWKGRTVSDNNVTVQMSTLRRTLAEHGGEGLIATVANAGYRFVGDVAEPPVPAPNPLPASATVPAAPPAAPREVRRLVFVAAIAGLALLAGGAAWVFWGAAPPPRLSIAVRPFRVIGLVPAQAFLAPAITEDLTTDLAHIPGSVVIARGSADALGEKNLTPARIGRRLGVRYVLEGSIEPAAAGFRINAQLVRTDNGYVLWTERFDTPLEALPDTQTTIVRRIASALDTQLPLIEGARALRERPDNPDAEDLFYGGRALLDHDDSMEGFTRAQHMLEEAVRRRPDFVDAQAQLGLTLLLKMRSHDDPDAEADLREARTAIAVALAAPRPSATAFAADARLKEGDGDCGAAAERAKAALAIEPNSVDALAVLARCEANEGRLDDAAAHVEMVMRLNPEIGRKGRLLLGLSQIRLVQGRYPEAIDLASQALGSMDRPQSTADCMGRIEYAHILLISAIALSGDASRARDLFKSYVTHWPNRSVWRVGNYAARRFSQLPGYRRFLAGLAAAGMPMYASEPASGPAVPAACPEFMPVPDEVSGAETIDTRGLLALIAKSNPHVVDLGVGAAVIKGADWVGDTSSTGKRDWLVREQGEVDRGTPLVIMGSGVYGTDSYAGARRLVAAGYRRVFWYRGGEEAWSAAGLAADDRRSEY